MKFVDHSQSDRSNWVMWQVKDPCPWMADSTVPTLPPHEKLGSGLDYLFIFRCKHNQLPDAQWHVNMACNQWLETWDVAIIYTGGTMIRVTVQWMSVDCMTLSPAKLNLIWTAGVNSRVMTGESQTQSWSIAGVYPLHYFVAKTHSYLTVYGR